jgi:AraC-like DNA-binding protein
VLGQVGVLDHPDDGLPEHLLVTAVHGVRGVAATCGRCPLDLLTGQGVERGLLHDDSLARPRDDDAVTYGERGLAVPGAVLWEREVGPSPGPTRILPDGCLDLLWDGQRLTVAGPDTAARWHVSPPGTRYTALRFSGGAGPALLGVPADELRDQTAYLDELWAAAETRELSEQVAADPATALIDWAARTATPREPVEPLGSRVLSMAAVGTPVAQMADRLGLGVRQLHRRCLPLFGYGPRHLSRVMRLHRALDSARVGTPLAAVAAGCGYADQAHLSREVRALVGTTPSDLLRTSGAPDVDDGVPHPPERVPRGEVPGVPRAREVRPGSVDLGGTVAAEGEGDAVTAHRG